MTTAVEHIDWAPRPAGFVIGRRLCNCGICVLGAGWITTHCGCCGNRLTDKDSPGWDGICAACWDQ